MIVRCKVKRCNHRVYGSQVKDEMTFQIKTFIPFAQWENGLDFMGSKPMELKEWWKEIKKEKRNKWSVWIEGEGGGVE